jgi:DNA-binding NtrC family response regulator
MSSDGTARCLVVDDDAQVRHALAKVIEGHGLATVQAGSGREALEVLQHHGEIPLIISDINMPEMDGIAFLKEALRRHPDLAVIMLTGVTEVATAVECLKLGALDYIAKPVVIEEVRARVD